MIYVALLATLLAQAEDTGSRERVDQARRLYRMGSAAYRSAQYTVAVRAFSEAYKLAPRPNVAFSLAQALRFQYFIDTDPRKLQRAVALYREYLVKVPRAGRRKAASEHLASLEPLLARHLLRHEMLPEPTEPEPAQLGLSAQPESAVAIVDGAAPVELPAIVAVEPGPHEVRFRAKGHAEEIKRVAAVTGRLMPVDAKLSELPAQLTIVAPDGAQVIIDGRGPSRATNQPFELNAGEHHLKVVARGRRPFAQTLDLQLGQKTTLAVKLEGTTQRIIAWSFLGASLVAVAASGLTALAALLQERRAQDIEALTETRALSLAEAMDARRLLESRDRLRSSAVILGGGAVLTAGLGLLLYYLDHPE